MPIQGREFEAGGYKCECIQGFEYPFEDPITYFDGQVMEAEFNNIVKDTHSRSGKRNTAFERKCSRVTSNRENAGNLVKKIVKLWEFY